MLKPRVCILRTAGTNCDKETAFSFEKAGAKAEFVHINVFCANKKNLEDYQILALSGGFSYGDDLGAGKVLANELRYKLSDDIKKFVSSGKLIIGICNGFQILVKSGLLPGNEILTQETSLIINDSGKFEDRWIHLRTPQAAGSKTKCIWAKDLPATIYLPIAHGEGKFITKDKQVLDRLEKNGQIVFQYCNQQGDLSGYPDNPNGSTKNIAGICDNTGRILGLMPHPERHAFYWQHPAHVPEKHGSGFLIIKNGVEYAKSNL
jgi:phosphoribosylformylglycinamidine synthase